MFMREMHFRTVVKSSIMCIVQNVRKQKNTSIQKYN